MDFIHLASFAGRRCLPRFHRHPGEVRGGVSGKRQAGGRPKGRRGDFASSFALLGVVGLGRRSILQDRDGDFVIGTRLGLQEAVEYDAYGFGNLRRCQVVIGVSLTPPSANSRTKPLSLREFEQ